MSYIPGICNFCGTGCGNVIKVQDGKVSGMLPASNHPINKGRLCVRGWHIHELLNTEDRITSPAVRKNGVLEPVSYDEAESIIYEKLLKYSGDEVAFLASPRASNEDNYSYMKMARSVFKSNNISLSSDSGHKNCVDVFNEGMGFPSMTGALEDIEKADFILVIGADITKQNPIIGSEIHKARLSGANVVTISSLSSQIAKLSKKHLQIKPGSKKVLLGAIAKNMLEENLQDIDFIQKNTDGFEGFANSLGALNNSEVENLTGISCSEIIEIAKALVESERAMAFFSTGISGLDKDTIAFIYNLFLLAGKVGKEGCSVNPVTGISNITGSFDMGIAPDLLTGYQTIGDADVMKKFKELWNTDLDDKPGKTVDALLGEGSSLKALFVVDHDEEIIRHSEKLKDLDFIVYAGAFNNGFAEYADVVIPTASFIESDGTYTNTERRVQLNRKKLEASNSIKPAWQIFTEIAGKGGMKWNFDSPEQIMKEIAAATPIYSGLSYEKLGKNLGIQWPCNEKYPEGSKDYATVRENGKMNFVTVAGDFGFQTGTDNFPFLLMIGKAQYFWHQNNIMKKTFIPKREYNATLLLYPKGFVEICKEDADEIGIRDKWPVSVVSDNGKMQISVKVSEDVKPGTAYVPYFIKDMVTKFLLEHDAAFDKGEDALIPVRIEKV